uniref:F-box domain-containing protein n=1 Tax=Chenopodium quinoa TaxID=63459 RepID=A0A803L894_CHEQI
MRNIRPRIDWSNLPVEIVRSIATHLQEDIDDLRRFRLTCKEWRRSTAISTILPLPINSTPRKKLYFSALSVVALPLRLLTLLGWSLLSRPPKATSNFATLFRKLPFFHGLSPMGVSTLIGFDPPSLR